jgi:hypothetical protein
MLRSMQNQPHGEIYKHAWRKDGIEYYINHYMYQWEYSVFYGVFTSNHYVKIRILRFIRIAVFAVNCLMLYCLLFNWNKLHQNTHTYTHTHTHTHQIIQGKNITTDTVYLTTGQIRGRPLLWKLLVIYMLVVLPYRRLSTAGGQT